ncbi:MAG: TatD family hydrolase [Candidatus Nealsonbacteria bacterium]|nr:TatD family hydrolase [Candidatus Nealsonbacteria bacterium]
MIIVDTHAHLQFRAYDKDRNEVIKRCLDKGVWTINVGTNYETSKAAVELARKCKEGIFASVGLHPINLDTGLVKIRVDPNEDSHPEKYFDYEKYRELAKNPKVVAIGEVGLDYYWKPKTKGRLEEFKKMQKELLALQLKLAKELDLPVIFHCRVAHSDLLEILNSNPKSQTPKLRGVIHSFTGSWDDAQRFLALGFYLGFNGIIFKKIEGLDFEINIKNTPLNRMLIETDCPYLTPSKESGRNEPIFIKHIIQKIADTKGVSCEEVGEITAKNAHKLFGVQ